MKAKESKLEFIVVIVQLKKTSTLDPDKFEERVESVAEGEKRIKKYLLEGYVYQWGKSEGKVIRDYYPAHQIEKATLTLQYT